MFRLNDISSLLRSLTSATIPRIFPSRSASVAPSAALAPLLRSGRHSAMFRPQDAYRPHILVIGGSYGGFSVVANLLNLLNGRPQLASPVSLPDLDRIPKSRPRITILDERDKIFHTMGSPLAMSSTDFAKEAWRSYDNITLLKDDVRTVQGSAIGLSMSSRVATYQKLGKDSVYQIPYDFLVTATGTSRRRPVAPEAATRGDHLHDVDNLTQCAKRVVVVGGGAVDIEFAAEIKTIYKNKEVILVQSRPHLLAAEPLPDSFKEKAANILDSLSIRVVTGCRVVTDTHSPAAASKNGLLALGASGRARIRASTANLAIQICVCDAPLHYALGDAISWSGIKRVGNAFIMGQFVATNILRQLNNNAWASGLGVLNETAVNESGPRPGKALLHCPPMKPMMALSIGNTALVYRGDGDSWTEEDQEVAVGRGLGIDRCSEYFGL